MSSNIPDLRTFAISKLPGVKKIEMKLSLAQQVDGPRAPLEIL